MKSSKRKPRKIPTITRQEDVLIRVANNGFIVTSFEPVGDNEYQKIETVETYDDSKTEAEAFVRCVHAVQHSLVGDFYDGWRLKIEVYNKYGDGK
jgi:hypothetical protein